MASNFEDELRAAINRTSQENGSGTPDFILAAYLVACLDAYNAAVQNRETWYGRGATSPADSGGDGPTPVDPRWPAKAREAKP